MTKKSNIIKTTGKPSNKICLQSMFAWNNPTNTMQNYTESLIKANNFVIEVRKDVMHIPTQLSTFVNK